MLLSSNVVVYRPATGKNELSRDAISLKYTSINEEEAQVILCDVRYSSVFEGLFCRVFGKKNFKILKNCAS